MSSIYLALEAERTSYEECMFALVHSAYNEGWRLVKEAIAMHTNPFSVQQEYNSIILPANSIIKTSLV